MYWSFCSCFSANFLARTLSCWAWWDGGEKERLGATFTGDSTLPLAVAVASSLRDPASSSRLKLLLKGFVEPGESSSHKEDRPGERWSWPCNESRRTSPSSATSSNVWLLGVALPKEVSGDVDCSWIRSSRDNL